MAESDPKIVAISAAMTDGTGLDAFAQKYPERFFDVGIAEQHAVTLAAGMAVSGLKPVAAIYSTFLQRAYDQVLHDICLQNANVVIAVDRAGVVGEDGETHQGAYDMAFLRHMPNMTIMAPAYDGELPRMLRFALYEADGPVAIRYPKGLYKREDIADKLARLNQYMDAIPAEPIQGDLASPILLGKGVRLLEGGDITIVAVGAMLEAAIEAAAGLAQRGFGADIISARFVKPLDAGLILSSVKKTGRLLVAEDGCFAGGFGSAVAEALAGSGVMYSARYCGLPDIPIPHGKREKILQSLGLCGEGLLSAALELLGQAL